MKVFEGGFEKTIIFLGDSITAGYGLSSAARAFPALIGEVLRERELPYRIINAGTSGDTTAGGLYRLPRLLEGRPSFLVVGLGANDMLRGVPAGQVEGHLNQIVSLTLAAGARPLLLGMRAVPFHGEAYRREFDGIYSRVAARHAVPVLPFFIEPIVGRADCNQADGIHPNAEGQRRIAAAVFSFLVQVLGHAEECPAATENTQKVWS